MRSRLQQVVDAALGLPQGETPLVATILWVLRSRVRSALADEFFRYVGGGMAVLFTRARCARRRTPRPIQSHPGPSTRALHQSPVHPL